MRPHASKGSMNPYVKIGVGPFGTPQRMAGARGLPAQAVPSRGPSDAGQCAEEECDVEECGDENHAPKNRETHICGLDTRPVLPLLLLTSTSSAGACMLAFQAPLWDRMFGGAIIPAILFGCLLAVTLGCMIYCIICDPGMLRRSSRRQAGTGSEDLQSEPASFEPLHPKAQSHQSEEPPLPKRAQKTWLYKLPIRRYDHYCRWVMNCIGLLNHREFIVLCIGLVVIGIVGVVVDVVLIIAIPILDSLSLGIEVYLVAHLVYSIAVIALTAPILHIHVGLISRNELAADWKRNDFYIITRSTSGTIDKPVNQLDEDEFNERFDSFAYDEKSNHFDHGCAQNCWDFWCIPRWSKDQLGDF